MYSHILNLNSQQQIPKQRPQLAEHRCPPDNAPRTLPVLGRTVGSLGGVAHDWVDLLGHPPTPDQDTLRTTESINGAIFTYSTL